MKSRRAVGGLISLIGIVIVFGIVSIAFLSMSQSQTGLQSTSLQASKILNDKGNEEISFKIDSCTRLNDTHASNLVFQVNNTSSNQIGLSSVLIDSKSIHRLADAFDLPEKINSLQSKDIIISDPTQIAIKNFTGIKIGDAESISLITEKGSKFAILHDFSGC